jgi:predicted nucleotidyltransferase
VSPDGINTETIVRICRAKGAVRVAMFGSLARGDAGPDSDVDLLVRFGKPIGLLALVRLERELSEALGRDVDLLTEGAVSPYLRERIEREQRVLYDA